MHKLNSQIKAFEALGHQVWATDIDDKGCWLEGGGQRVLLRPYKRYIPAGISAHANSALALLAAARSSQFSFDLCYIRKPLCDPWHLKALKILRGKGVAVVEEIPTFPYDAELENQKNLSASIFLAIDRYFRKRLHKYVNFITTYSFDESIFGVPALTVQNAVTVEALPLHQPQPSPEGTVRMVAVSSMCFWHGYDRAIKGLGAYYSGPGPHRDIQLHLVGDGPEKARWQQLAASLGLENRVVFEGVRSGEPLNALFNQCDFALSSLGGSRKGLFNSFELKTREYIARGIPFVHACNDPAADAVRPFSLKVPNDESDLSLPQLLKFWDAINGKGGEATALLRRYAMEHLRWEAQMQRVIDRLKAPLTL